MVRAEAPSERKRTLPSASRMVAPPVWKLYSPRPLSLVQLMTHGPGEPVPSNREPENQFSPLSGSPQPAPSVAPEQPPTEAN